MARIVGVNLPSNKRIEIGLTYIFGIGKSLSNKILEKTGISADKRTKDLTTEDIEKLRAVIEIINRTEGTLKRDISSNIKRLKDINCYRGSRHTKRLPVRGQRTKTNARTVRGRSKITIGSGKRPSSKKT